MQYKMGLESKYSALTSGGHESTPMWGILQICFNKPPAVERDVNHKLWKESILELKVFSSLVALVGVEDKTKGKSNSLPGRYQIAYVSGKGTKVGDKQVSTGYLMCCSKVMQKMNDSIIYGGILNETKVRPCDEVIDLAVVVEFALKEASRISPDASKLQSESYLQPYKLTDCSTMEIFYTRDGKHKAIFQRVNPFTGDIIDTPIYWGMFYKFKVSIEDSMYSHSFTVTEYVDEELYLIHHTVSKTMSIYEPSTNVDCLESIKPLSSCSTGIEETCSNDPFTHMLAPSLHSTQQCPVENPLQNFKALKYLDPNKIRVPGMERSKVETRTFESLYNKSQEFTILSFNIWNTNTVQPDSDRGTLYKQRLKHIIKVCDKTDADVIAFQEVRFEDGKGGSWGPNQVKHLSRLLKKYQYVFQPAQVQEHGLPYRIEEGVAIFSKHPISHTDYLLLSRDRKDVADTHQRILLHARINIPEFGPIHVFNTHLSLSHTARQRTVVEIWDHIKQYSQPVFLTGDFNAEAHNDEIRFLAGEVALKGLKTTGLHDTWRMKHGDQDKGFTFNTLEEELTKRIDLIFMMSHPHINFLDVEIIDDGLRKEFAASDHTALLAKFQARIQLRKD